MISIYFSIRSESPHNDPTLHKRTFLGTHFGTGNFLDTIRNKRMTFKINCTFISSYSLFMKGDCNQGGFGGHPHV